MNTTTAPGSLPTTIPVYLDQLRAALSGADKAMIQDALYDAEEYLRAEMAANPGTSEADVIASVAGSYGAPEEVADTIGRALQFVPRDRLIPCTNCGLAPMSRGWPTSKPGTTSRS